MKNDILCIEPFYQLFFDYKFHCKSLKLKNNLHWHVFTINGCTKVIILKEKMGLKSIFTELLQKYLAQYFFIINILLYDEISNQDDSIKYF